FFSSSGRHTSSYGDWSSDVCSSDLSVPGIIRECAEAGVRGAIVISAGFRETGAAGVALEHELFETARRANMRIIGPNCLGVMSRSEERRVGEECGCVGAGVCGRKIV